MFLFFLQPKQGGTTGERTLSSLITTNILWSSGTWAFFAAAVDDMLNCGEHDVFEQQSIGG